MAGLCQLLMGTASVQGDVSLWGCPRLGGGVLWGGHTQEYKNITPESSTVTML